MKEQLASDQWRECAECGNRWLGGYSHCCRCAQAVINRLTLERDQYKKQAEINAQTVIRQAQEMRQMERDFRAEAREAAAEASWKERQGEDYGSY